MADLEDILGKYVASAAEVRKAVTGMNREQLTARPVEGKWSTLEVLCHLVRVFAPRCYLDRRKRLD